MQLGSTSLEVEMNYLVFGLLAALMLSAVIKNAAYVELRARIGKGNSGRKH
jgi:hypothetical protein